MWWHINWKQNFIHTGQFITLCSLLFCVLYSVFVQLWCLHLCKLLLKFWKSWQIMQSLFLARFQNHCKFLPLQSSSCYARYFLCVWTNSFIDAHIKVLPFFIHHLLIYYVSYFIKVWTNSFRVGGVDHTRFSPIMMHNHAETHWVPELLQNQLLCTLQIPASMIILMLCLLFCESFKQIRSSCIGEAVHANFFRLMVTLYKDISKIHF